MEEKEIKSIIYKYSLRANLIIIGFFVCLLMLDYQLAENAREIAEASLKVPHYSRNVDFTSFGILMFALIVIWHSLTKILTELFKIKNESAQ